MASPQVEDGFTKIANTIMEALTKIRIPGETRQVIDVIIRKTYGFNKKEDSIALSQFCLSTGMKKPTCVRAINKGLDMNIIIKKDNDNGNSYSFNKNFEEWKPLSKKITLSKKIMPVIQKDNKSLSKKIPTINNTKDTFTKDTLACLFDDFWKAYPKKRSKKDALKAWLKLNPGEHLVEQILQAVQRAKTSADWKSEKGKYIPYPATWLNAGGWEDDISTRSDEQEEEHETPEPAAMQDTAGRPLPKLSTHRTEEGRI